jgi:ribosomal protein S18 acetylase RimI-like enzyme
VIRAAVPADALSLAALFNALNSLDGDAPETPMTPALLLRDLICAEPKALLLVAEQDGTLAGFATGALIYDAVRAAWAMLLLDLYVAPEARRRGHARGLMACLAAEALRHGARCLWWGVDEGDEEATLFYRAIGARSEGMFSSEIIEGAALDALAKGAP